MVRHNEADDNAGFKLTCESTDGFKNRRWYTVPDNKERHTVKRTIKDAQFVSYWGSTFRWTPMGVSTTSISSSSVMVTKLDQ